MLLALIDAAIVAGVIALIGVLGYWMDRQAERGERQDNHLRSNS